MNPKNMFEKILADTLPANNDVDNAFDISELLEDVKQAKKAMQQLQEAAYDYENSETFNDDISSIDRKIQDDKFAMEFEGVDAAYEL